MTSVPLRTTATGPATALPKPRRSKWLVVAPAAVTVLGLSALLATYYRPAAPVELGGTYYTVQLAPMDVKISKDGELAAVNNIDIICQVENQSTIQTIVKEGAFVHKGDVLVTLDSAQIKQKLEDITLEVEKAEADVTTAREMREIQVSKNAADLEAATVSLTLAKLDLQEYTEGSFPQELANAKTTLDMARITLKNKEEDFEQTNALFTKGFVTAADVKKDELAVVEARNAVKKAETALHVLERFTHEMELASKKNALAQAEQKLIRVQRENASAMVQRDAELRAREQNLAAQKRRLEHNQEQLAACTITAPADGLVVYGSSNDRWSNTQIQEGAQVRERQLLIRLPDTSQMKAVCRIQEAQVPRLEVGQRALVRIVGQPKPIPATLTKISVLSDSSQRWWNPDLKEYPVELLLDQTPQNLKPGIGVTADIFIQRLTDVATVPLAAVYSAGTDTYVFARDGGAKPKPIKVALGHVNETHAEITQGLQPGTQVLLLQAAQGRQLLEDAGIKVQPTTRPASEDIPKGPPVPLAKPATPEAKPAEGQQNRNGGGGNASGGEGRRRNRDRNAGAPTGAT